MLKPKQKNMAYKIFLDVNVIMDFTLKRDNHAEIKKIISSIEDGYHKGFITSATLHTLSYFLTKEYGVKRAKEVLLTLLSIFSVIDASKEVIKNALHANYNDIEDALQVYTALSFKMDFFLTSDKKLKKESSTILPILTASEFVKEYI